MHHLILNSTDSRYATDAELGAAGIDAEQLPPHMRREDGTAALMAQQAQTIAALRSDVYDIVINKAMTGDGKSFAGQYLPLVEGWDAMTLYPTNELSLDQRQSLKLLLDHWQPAMWQGKNPGRIDAAQLDEIEAAMAADNRPDALLKVMNTYPLLLTNPDIFHLMMNFRYQKYGQAADTIPALVASYYRLITFDEFGLFGVPQVASVLSAILLMREMSIQRPRFLFLSATPQELLVRAAECVGLRIKSIAGDYQHGYPESSDYRRILQEVDLYLHPLRLEDWVRVHADLILDFFEQHSHAKGVMICNSVGTAYRVHQLLRELCPQINIGNDPNTGLTAIDERERHADLLVATSTIDVGVDFRINFLVFESIDAASHLQRLGRLGRHKEDTERNPFTAFEAHALLPAWVVERLAQRFPDGSRINRDGDDGYRAALQEDYPSLQSFERYLRKWGGVQAAHVIAMLNKPEIRVQTEGQRERLKAHYDRLYERSIKRYFTLKDKPAIRDEATSFRGSSPFTILVRQTSGKERGISSYNLLSLLLQADLTPADLEIYYRKAEESKPGARKILERAKPLAAYELKGWLTETRKISFQLRQELNPIDLTGVIQLAGVQISIDGGLPLAELRRLNDALDQRWFAARLVTGAPDDVRKRLRLGYHFGLYPFTGKLWRPDEERLEAISGSVAFAREALLLDSIYFPPREEPPSQAFIC
jgi:CRISPR-associated endonuclease/helicase Cas3